MLRAQQRQLRELMERKRIEEDAVSRLQDKKRLKLALDANQPLPGDLRNDVELREKLDLEDARTLSLTVSADDEYRMAGTYDPRILITTSQKATAPCVRFAKELTLMIPNATRVNRGQMAEAEIVELCKTDGVTDLIEVSGADGEGRPKLMRVTHMPFGPTIYFTLSDISMRSDLAEKPDKMKQVYPHLVFDNFGGRMGPRIMSTLKYLFPVCKDDSLRVISFINRGNDLIYVRHHMVEKNSTLRKFHQADPALEQMTTAQKDHLLEQIQLDEQGPRFTLEPFKIIRGTPDQKHAEVEWQKSYYMRKAAKVIGASS